MAAQERGSRTKTLPLDSFWKPRGTPEPSPPFQTPWSADGCVTLALALPCWIQDFSYVVSCLRVASSSIPREKRTVGSGPVVGPWGPGVTSSAPCRPLAGRGFLAVFLLPLPRPESLQPAHLPSGLRRPLRGCLVPSPGLPPRLGCPCGPFSPAALGQGHALVSLSWNPLG